jgi:membrane protease YdiL (CAAX protease family)
MENNTLENKPKYDLSDDKKEFKNKIYAVIAFLILFFVVSALAEYLFAFIVSKAKSLDTDLLIKSLTKFDYDEPQYDESIISARYLVLALANLTGYLLSFIALCFFLRKDLKEDLFKLKDDKKFFLIFISISIVVFITIVYLFNYLFKRIGIEESNNQKAIEGMFKYGYGAIMIIPTLLFAPMVEELIYRKCVFYFLRNLHPLFSYVTSVALFSLPHMITTSSDAKNWFLALLLYIIPAILLSLIYHKGKKNIYASFIVHFINNLVAVILIFI